MSIQERHRMLKYFAFIICISYGCSSGKHNSDEDIANETVPSVEEETRRLVKMTYLKISAPPIALIGSSITLKLALYNSEGQIDKSKDEDILIKINNGHKTMTIAESLLNGVGCVTLLVPPDSTKLEVTSPNYTHNTLTIDLYDADLVTQLSGSLNSDELIWNKEFKFIHVVDDIIVPFGAVLRIGPGVTVLLDEGKQIKVYGKIEANGTEENPILLTAFNPENPWGGLLLKPLANAELEHTYFNNGGKISAKGHTRLGILLKADSASVKLTRCLFCENKSKCIFTHDTKMIIENTIFNKCSISAELTSSNVNITGSFFLNTKIGKNEKDDYDALLISSSQNASIEKSIFNKGGDDAIDLNWTSAKIQGNIITNFTDKGISVYSSNVTITDNIILNSHHAVTIKSKGKAVIKKLISYNNNYGVYAWQKYIGEGGGYAEIYDSIFYNNKVEDLYWDEFSEQPKISFSNVNKKFHYLGKNNREENPLFVLPTQYNFTSKKPGSGAKIKDL